MVTDEPMKIVIVGLGTGGLYSSKTALGYNRKAEITVVEKRTYDMFSPCGLPFAIEGVVPSFEDLKFTVPSNLRRLKKHLAHEVQAIYPDDKIVEIKNIDNWDTKTLKFDSLILATGGSPIMLPIEGAKELLNRGVYVVSTIENSQILQKAAKEGKNAVLIGGGPIGLEIAVALKKLGVNVAITKRSPPVFPRLLDEDMGKIVEEYLKSEGFELHFGESTDGLNTNAEGNVESVTIGGRDIPADIVIMGVGTEPNVELAQTAGLEIGDHGIVVDDHLRTSNPSIYGLGDCIQTFNYIDKTPMASGLATSAFLQAHVVGVNASGGDITYPGDLNTFVTVIGDLEIAAVGYNSTEAEKAGFSVITSKAKAKTKPDYFPGTAPVTVKLIIDRSSGRLIGGQAISENGATGAAWRINMISMAIRTGMTIDKFMEVELAYTPPVSEVYDVLSMASEFGTKKYQQLR